MHIKYSEKTERRLQMIVKAMINLAVAGLGIWLAWKELGQFIFYEPVFWLIIALWGYLSISLFWVKWDEAAKKTTDEKIDDLIEKLDIFIAEIKLDREKERKGVSNNGE
ncbi:MAG: hypothetical protein ABIK32_06205 [Chloroflexota bacterium]|nr:hypothetical protein [Chloroflexota bacterium]